MLFFAREGIFEVNAKKAALLTIVNLTDEFKNYIPFEKESWRVKPESVLRTF